MMIRGLRPLEITLRPSQIFALLAIIQITRDGVRLKLLRKSLAADERAILEHLEQQLENCRLEMERALAEADQLLLFRAVNSTAST